MSKIVTLSNIERFVDKLEIGNGTNGTRYKYIPQSNRLNNGNVYISGTRLYIQQNPQVSWTEIRLYEKKPTKHALAIKAYNVIYYAGIVETTDADASPLRVRIKGKTYAVAKQVSTFWNGTGSVVGNNVEVLSTKYLYSDYPLPFFGDKEIEVYLKCSQPENTTVATNKPIFFRLYQTGTSPTNYVTQNKTNYPRAANVPFEIYDDAAVIYFELETVESNGVFSTKAPSMTQLIYVPSPSTDPSMWAEHEYLLKWIPDYGAELYFDDELKVSSRTITDSYKYLKNPVNLSVALGDICSALSGGKMPKFVISDFHAKIDGTTVLSFEDMKRQFS